MQSRELYLLDIEDVSFYLTRRASEEQPSADIYIIATKHFVL
ncbi:hypothetical protein ACFSPU_07220 [Haoranjiania flava]